MEGKKEKQEKYKVVKKMNEKLLNTDRRDTKTFERLYQTGKQKLRNITKEESEKQE